MKISKTDIQKLQVSSTVKNDKSSGKQNIFDGRDDTCWSSDEDSLLPVVYVSNGSPQWIWVEFKEPRDISSFSIQFQGGFVGSNCQAEFTNGEQLTAVPFYPEDINSVQNFTVGKTVTCKQVKLTFGGSTDFFGRIVVYSVDFE